MAGKEGRRRYGIASPALSVNEDNFEWNEFHRTTLFGTFMKKYKNKDLLLLPMNTKVHQKSR